MFNIEVDILFYVPTKSILKETRSMPRSISVPNISMKTHMYKKLGVSDFCLTPKWAIFQACHDENKFHFDEMVKMMSSLY